MERGLFVVRILTVSLVDGKAQKSHGVRSVLYGGCSNGVSPIHFFQAEHRIQFRSRPYGDDAVR
jgi:hypothetical protein